MNWYRLEHYLDGEDVHRGWVATSTNARYLTAKDAAEWAVQEQTRNDVHVRVRKVEKRHKGFVRKAEG